MKEFTLASYIDRTRKAIAEYSKWATWFEVGNEIGGDWMGPDDAVAEKVSSALNICRFAGVKTAVTWYLSGTFPGRSRSVVATWNLPSDLALYSWYPNYSPRYEPDWNDWFNLLAMKYPNAQVGFGEFGGEPNPKTHIHRAKLIEKIYAIKPACPRFIGGYFYWDTWLDVCGRHWDDVTAALTANIPKVIV